MKGKAIIRKPIVITGIVLLVAGIALAAFSSVEPYIEEEIRDVWDVRPPTLEPNNATFWGRLMHGGWWFQLNVSSSHPIRLTISVIEHDPTPVMVPIFGQVGTSFTEKVIVDATGTHQVDIKNEGEYTVNIWGTVIAKESEETKYRTVYSYATPGTIVALTGVVVLLVGIYTKPKSLKRKSRRNK